MCCSKNWTVEWSQKRSSLTRGMWENKPHFASSFPFLSSLPLLYHVCTILRCATTHHPKAPPNAACKQSARHLQYHWGLPQATADGSSCETSRKSSDKMAKIKGNKQVIADTCIQTNLHNWNYMKLTVPSDPYSSQTTNEENTLCICCMAPDNFNAICCYIFSLADFSCFLFLFKTVAIQTHCITNTLTGKNVGDPQNTTFVLLSHHSFFFFSFNFVPG